MTRLNLMALAIAMVALAVSAWTVSRTPAPVPGPAVEGPSPRNDLETRIAALEDAFRVARDAPDTGVLDRLNEIERRLQAVDSARALPLPPTEADPTGKPDAKAAAGVPDEDDVDRFRRLQEAARKQEREKKAQARVDKALKGLQITLTDEQRSRLAAVWSGFETRRDEIWVEVKRDLAAEGRDVDWKQVITDTRLTVRREFAERITPIVSGGDAERIAGRLLDWDK